jgi:molybdenum cofactor cytidylyltransferase
MKIKNLDPKEGKGSILAQSYKLSERTLSKGTYLSEDIVELLDKENMQTIVCAVPQEGDLHEDTAAEAISKAIDRNKLYSEEASTGRVNFRAPTLSIVRYERALHFRSLNTINFWQKMI